MERYVDLVAEGHETDALLFGPARSFKETGRRMIEAETKSARISKQRRVDGWTLDAWLDGDAVVRVEGDIEISVAMLNVHRSNRESSWSLRWHHHPDLGWVLVDTHSANQPVWESELACSHPGGSWQNDRGWRIQPLWNLTVRGAWTTLAALTNTSASPMRFLDVAGTWRTLGAGEEAVLSSRPRKNANAKIAFALSEQRRFARQKQALVPVTVPDGHPRLGWCGTGF